MPTGPLKNRIASALAVAALAAALAGCGSGSTATNSAGVAPLTTTTTLSSSSAPTNTTASTTTSSTSTTSAATSSATTSSTAGSPHTNPAGKGGAAAKSAVGKLAVASAAFPHGGQIPARYTCDGGNVSPPLQWGKVPAGTTQMFLLALSLTASPAGAIRWAVGGIAPSAGGFPAGQLPAGAVVGRNSEGHIGWAGICPPKGKSQAVVVLVYALRHPLNLSPGFNPQAVQRQLSGNSAGTGVAFGAYHRP